MFGQTAFGLKAEAAQRYIDGYDWRNGIRLFDEASIEAVISVATSFADVTTDPDLSEMLYDLLDREKPPVPNIFHQIFNTRHAAELKRLIEPQGVEYDHDHIFRAFHGLKDERKEVNAPYDPRERDLNDVYGNPLYEHVGAISCLDLEGYFETMSDIQLTPRTLGSMPQRAVNGFIGQKTEEDEDNCAMDAPVKSFADRFYPYQHIEWEAAGAFRDKKYAFSVKQSGLTSTRGIVCIAARFSDVTAFATELKKNLLEGIAMNTLFHQLFYEHWKELKALLATKDVSIDHEYFGKMFRGFAPAGLRPGLAELGICTRNCHYFSDIAAIDNALKEIHTERVMAKRTDRIRWDREAAEEAEARREEEARLAAVSEDDMRRLAQPDGNVLFRTDWVSRVVRRNIEAERAVLLAAQGFAEISKERAAGQEMAMAIQRNEMDATVAYDVFVDHRDEVDAFVRQAGSSALDYDAIATFHGLHAVVRRASGLGTMMGQLGLDAFFAAVEKATVAFQRIKDQRRQQSSRAKKRVGRKRR
ncbi:hypothetical protein J8273_0425 [Carpediemonas membranifera]|uniref:Uncharacterized protein n=1 Tax=Carpediemonas membranifera TaxID=201153 RepID=A0A8J6AZI8_9EUKA|nr:hypothetical protein J8273_0425 [Carpediemonas membranifera]|eukprot:KAG9395205.1 hypothetical protein J8273_0425 [Carpediemonas membranifera]